MERIRGLFARLGMRSGAAVLAALLLVFCLSSVAPADSAGMGCQGPEASPRMCGQPGVSEPLIALAPEFPQVERQRAVFVGLEPAPRSEIIPQCHPDLSAPRAPPRSEERRVGKECRSRWS